MSSAKMNSSKQQFETFAFPLEVDDGWPPCAVESLPIQKVPNGYMVLTPPLFVKELSVNDIIEVRLQTGSQVVESWRHVIRSTHTTIWLLRMHCTTTIDTVLAKLRTIGCTTVALDQFGAYSIDVPEAISISTIDTILEELDGDSVAIAFPALRHPDDS